MAQNTIDIDYVSCAVQLQNSIKRVMPNENVTIITTDMLPHGDLAPNSEWKLINDWQVYEASPYEYTIKLEADMIIPVDISHWWDILKERDVVVSSHVRNYSGELSTVKAYRNFTHVNKLPDVYNAITYFKKSNTAETFYKMVRSIFEDWDEWKHKFICDKNEPSTTDWVYSIACHIMGTDKTTMNFPGMSMVHMKQYINDLVTTDWTNELLIEYTDPIKVATFPQRYPFHYHTKTFAKELEKHYG